MFQVNDIILYGSHSVCKIMEICQRKIGNENLLYYTLKPVFDNKSTILVPCENTKLTGKMRPVLSLEEVYAFIEDLRSGVPEWIDDDAVRKEKYEAIIHSGDRGALAVLIRTLYLHKEKRRAIGKKLHAADEHLLDHAQKLLHEELAYVLNLQPQEIPSFIAKQLEASEQQ